MEEEREAVRQKLRDKYNLEKQYSIDEPIEDSDTESESEEEEELEENIEEEKSQQEEKMERLASERTSDSVSVNYIYHLTSEKMAVLLSSLVTGLFSMYLLVSFIHLKIKASVSNMRLVAS